MDFGRVLAGSGSLLNALGTFLRYVGCLVGVLAAFALCLQSFFAR